MYKHCVKLYVYLLQGNGIAVMIKFQLLNIFSWVLFVLFVYDVTEDTNMLEI